MSSGGIHLSKEFFELLKAIGESKSKQEEDRIIAREIQVLKAKLEGKTKVSRPGSGPSSSGQNALVANKKKAKEFLIRLLYVEMLGHDASFGYIKAVELAASSSIMHKRTGYLLCSCCLSPDHEFRFMLVNQMQRDLISTNVLEVCAALIAATNLITADMVPAMSSHILKLLDHASETVRKKAIIAIHRFHQIAPETVTTEEMVDKLRKILCDRDPSVMGSSLNVIDSMAQVNPKIFKDLSSSLVSILKQIIEHRLPSDFDYHRVPAPWMQMRIVRILASLGRNDASTSNGMYEILGECLRKAADIGISAGYAIAYECVKTITAIYPNPVLLDAAADSISRFLDSQSHNLKYLGVTGLAAIVQGHPKYAQRHQIAVIECLEDRDETLQWRTLDLLYRMTNPQNVQFITEKLLQFLTNTTDVFLSKDLTGKVCRLAERYAPNNLWYIETMTELYEINGDMVDQDVSQNLMALIAEGGGDDDGDGQDNEGEDDVDFRRHAVELYASLLDGPHGKIPRPLIETMAWVLGEYAYLSQDFNITDILDRLCGLIRGGGKLSPQTRRIVVTAIMKLVAQAGSCPPQAASVVDDFTRSKDLDLQRRCIEFQGLLTSAPHLLSEILPIDASCEDVQVDVNLNFLDSFVGEALRNGASRYEKPEDDGDDDEDNDSPSGRGKSAFKMTAYEKPTAPAPGAFSNMSGIGNNSKTGAAVSGVTPPPGSYAGSTDSQVQMAQMNSGEPQLTLRNVTNVWGKGGMNVSQQHQSSTQTPAAAATAPPGGGFTTQPPQPTQDGNTWSSSYPSESKSSSFPSPEPEKSEEMIRKERMAAALFGGGSTSAGVRLRKRNPNSNAQKSASPAVSTSAPSQAPAPAPAQVPAPAPDLLDFGAPTLGPVPVAAPVDFNVDILTPTQSDGHTIAGNDIQIPSSAESPTAVVLDSADPFAGAGLLDGVGDTSLSPLESNKNFEHNGVKMRRLPITTTEFGQQWGTVPHVTNLSETSHKVSTLDSFMNLSESIGFEKIETIAITNEGICGGMVGESIVVLHGKISPLGDTNGSKLDITIKSTDVSLGGCLAMYMQNMIR